MYRSVRLFRPALVLTSLTLLGAARPVAFSADLSLLIDPHWAVVIAAVLANPIVASVLLALGIIGFVTELKAGAHGLGLLTGLVALGLFFGSSVLLGLSGLGTLLILALGFALLGVEVVLLPGHGFSGILGSLLIAASVVMARLGPSPTAADVVGALALLGTSLVITGAVTYAFIRHLPNSGRFSGLIHKESVGAGAGFVAALPRGDLVGQEGVVVTDLRPAGTAQVGSERIDVVTEGGYIGAGQRIVVVRAEGYRHVVRAAGPNG
jgi:membrane-bound serine protease (ClpP class)